MSGGGSQPFRKLIEGNREDLRPVCRDRRRFLTFRSSPSAGIVGLGKKGKLPPEKMSVWYPDRTPKLVEEFVRLGVRWLDKHPDKTTPQRLLLIYAWNENGEGGYLTPTEKDGTEYLKAVQRAITAER